MKTVFKAIYLLLCVVIVISNASCANSSNGMDNDKISVICTAFPQYDWVREIAGERLENFEIILLTDNGIDMHSYQPTVDDIIKISDCDLIISVGGSSEKWVEDAVKNSSNPDVHQIKLIEVLGEKALFTDFAHNCDDEHDHTGEYDEHVWLSLKNSMIFCEEIAENMAELDSDNAELYDANCRNYIEQLSQLDLSVQEGVESADHSTLLFADRFPFRYFINDYGLEYCAAFDGCTSDSEASFDTIFTLSETINKLGLDTVLTVDGSDGKIAQTVVSNTKTKNQQILLLESIQSVSRDEIDNGATYLSFMQSNVQTILKALH